MKVEENHSSPRFQMVEKWRGKINGEFATKGIEWTFSPPSAPHTGGMWERYFTLFLTKTKLAPTLSTRSSSSPRASSIHVLSRRSPRIPTTTMYLLRIRFCILEWWQRNRYKYCHRRRNYRRASSSNPGDTFATSWMVSGGVGAANT